VTRRIRGQGTIRLRSNGRYEGRYYTVERKQVSVYGASRADVEAKLELAVRSTAMGIQPAGPRLTVEMYLRDWLASRKGDIAANTLRRYRGICEVNIIPAIGAMPLVNLSGHVVERLLTQSIRAGLSPRTVGHIRAVLRTALNRAVRHGLLQRNAASDAYPPRIRRVVRPILTDLQVRKLLGALEGDSLRPLYALALGTGIREGELLGLRWGDVDLDGNIVHVEQQLQRIEGADGVRRLRLVPTKTEASKRTVGIGQALSAILRAHRASQLRDRLRAGDEWRADDFVFTRPDGQPLYAEVIDKHWRRLREQLGLPRNMHFHDLRGTAASHMHALGAQAREIQATLGHTDSRTTMNLYTHALDAGLRANANRMDVLFERAKG
jgi:integrase